MAGMIRNIYIVKIVKTGIFPITSKMARHLVYAVVTKQNITEIHRRQSVGV